MQRTDHRPLTRRPRPVGILAAVVATLAAALIAAAPAAAHDFWIDPPAAPEVGEPVALGLRVGEAFAGEPVARDPRRIERFVALGPDGAEQPVAGLAGWEPAGRFRPTRAGGWVAVYRSRPAAITLGAETFERYLAEEGLETVAAARATAGAGDTPGREIYSRCAKTLLPVAGPAGGGAADRDRFTEPVGLELELVPEADPFAAAQGASLPLRLLYRGRPLAGSRVVALRRGDPAGSRAMARSAADGRVELALGSAGDWLIKTVHMVPAPAGSDADWESLWATLTFRLPPVGEPADRQVHDPGGG